MPERGGAAALCMGLLSCCTGLLSWEIAPRNPLTAGLAMI